MNVKSGKNYVAALVAVFMFGSMLINPPRANNIASYAIFLASSLFGLVIILVMAGLYKRYPGMDFFAIVKHKGNVFFVVVLTLLALYALLLASVTMGEFAGQGVLFALPRTSPLLIIALLAGASLYLATKGVEVMGRLAVLVIVFVFAIVAIIISLSAHKYDFADALTAENSELFSFAMQTISAFGGVIIPVAIAPNLMGEKEGHKQIAKGGIIGFFGSVGIIFLIMAHNLLVLGGDTYAGVRYPTIFVSGLVMTGDFLQRLEGLALGLTVPLSMFKVAICLGFISLSFREMFFSGQDKKDTNIHSFVSSVFASGLALFFFKGSTPAKNISEYLPSFYFAVQLVVVIVIFAILSIGKKKKAQHL